jgi:TonB family protein
MSDRPADSSALPPTPNESWLPGRKSPVADWTGGPKPSGEGWSRRKFLLVLGFVFAFHLALVFLFGTKKQIVARPVVNVPHLHLTEDASEFIALGDPTLFARPNTHDIVTAFWRRLPPMGQQDFDWPAPPGYLEPAPGDWGAQFRDFVQHSPPLEFPLDFKPEPKAIVPEAGWADTMPRTTSVEISGELARRPLLNPKALVPPPLPGNDVMAPSTVQALVDTDGNVFSAVVPEPNADHDADQLALQVVRNLRFAPAPRPAVGDITFIWHTEPLTNTNTNALP